MYQLKVLPQAQKDFDKLPTKAFHAIKKKIIDLTNHPRLEGAIKLMNDEGYRIRIGDYRVLYRIDDKAKEVFIYRVKHRKDVYRYVHRQ